MSYTLESIRTQVKNRISDQNYSNGMINQFINDEQREILNYYDLPFNRTSSAQGVAIGAHTLPLPADCQKVKSLRITAPDGYDGSLDPYFLEHNRFVQAFREPQYYNNNQINWWTVYNTDILFAYNADRNYTLQIDYIKRAPELATDSDVPILPEEFQEVLVLGAMVRCYESNDDNDIAQYQQGKKNLLVQSLVKRYAPQQVAKTEIVRNTYRGI